MYRYKDIFLVTGATSGIGKGVTIALLEKGASVIAAGRSEKKLTLLHKEINNNKLSIEKCDLSNSDLLDKWIINLSNKYGKLKGLVLAAGIQQITPISAPRSVEKSKKLFEINYFSNIQLAKGFCDRRVNRGKESSVVFLSSIASIRANKGIVSYAASKGAINSAVPSLALEASKQGIRVNAILPGFVITEMTQEWKDIYSEGYIEELNRVYPLGLGSLDDVVKPILFLLSDDSKWVTGTNLIVDGGGSL